jgi:catechol 2,3-dioxygenase-like lactoylglutathione lyase family enzyme
MAPSRSPSLVPTHINLVSRDIDASWAFYSSVLGVKHVGYFHEKKVVGRFGEFDFFIEEVPDFVPYHEQFHLGFRTTPDGVRRWARRLRRKGIRFVKGNNPVADVHAVKGTNRVAVYFEDPDGTVIEIYSDE